jgi:hypothetical protein
MNIRDLLMHSLAWLGAAIWCQQIHFGSTLTRGSHHSLAEPKLHLSRLQIGNDDDQSAH